MRLIRHVMSTAFIGLAGIGFAGFAHAQAAGEASPPEIGEAPSAVEIQVTPEPGSDVEIEVESAAVEPEIEMSTPGELPSPLDTSVEGPSSIEQRVDNTSTNEAIRVAPRSRKNVTRLDNRPNKPRIKPIAVISGPVAPWGYTTRYMNGEVQTSSAKKLKETGRPGAPGTDRQGGLTNSSGGSGMQRLGSSRKRE